MDFLPRGVPSAAPAIAVYIRDHGADLPAVTFNALAADYPSGVERLLTGCEALYAAADVLPAEGHTLCAQLARLAQEGAFDRLGQTDRAALVIAAMRRRLGELDEDAAPPADDPPPLEQFIPA